MRVFSWFDWLLVAIAGGFLIASTVEVLSG